MQSDPKQCLYCTNNQTLKDLMIEFAQLRVSRAFVFKEQTYYGRCLVAYKDHVSEIVNISDEERNAWNKTVTALEAFLKDADTSENDVDT